MTTRALKTLMTHNPGIMTATDTEEDVQGQDNGFSMIEVIIVVMFTLILSGVGFYWMLSSSTDAEDHVRETSELIVETQQASDDFTDATRNAVAVGPISSSASYGKLMIETADGQCQTWFSHESQNIYAYLAYFEGENAQRVNNTAANNLNADNIRNAVDDDNENSNWYPTHYYSGYAPSTWGNHFIEVNNDPQNGILLNFSDFNDRQPVMTQAVKPRTLISRESHCWG